MRTLLSFLLVLAAGATTREEVVYRQTPQGELKMTIFYPEGWKATDARPGIVFFFGGGFTSGDPRQFFSKAGYLSSRGMVAASAEYRTKNKHQTAKEDALADCQAAYLWLKEHATQQGIDPAKLSAGGGSSGGACALSILKIGARPASFVLFNPGSLAELDPPADLPRTILFFGSADPTYADAQRFLAKAPRGRVELFVAKGEPHGFFNDRGDGAWHASTTYLADSFLRGAGLLVGKPTIALPQGSRAILFAEGAMRPSPPGQPQPVPEGVTAHQNVEYAPGLLLDIFVPPGPPKPLVVWIHGGAWQNGNKENPPTLRLLPGFAAASIRYRLSQVAPMPAQIDDCRAAIRFLRANAAKYGYNGAKIGVWGSSAGGHLVALLGAIGEGEDKVQAVVDWFGPTALRRMSMYPSRMDHDSPEAPEARLIGGPVQQNAELAEKANPITYVTKDDPPYFIQHGDADPLVPMEQSELLRDALKKAGIAVEFEILHGAGHGGPAFQAPANLEKVKAFLARHLL
ncbi:MAG: alpha/beta hydrolase [Bryobacteraceae bacterium]|nr:alpha/beta hydrolase [Bryobacteraceae bacterium]